MCELGFVWFGFLNFFTIFVEVRILICSSIENLSTQLLLPIYRSLSASIVHGIFFCGCSALVFWVAVAEWLAFGLLALKGCFIYLFYLFFFIGFGDLRWKFIFPSQF